MAPPCALCHSYNRDCTFLARPQKRKRPAVDLVEDARSDGAQTPSPRPAINLSPVSPTGEVILQRHIPAGDPANPNKRAQTVQRLSEPARTDVQNSCVSSTAAFSLAINTAKSAVWVGESGEADPHLCRRYQYDSNNECVLSKITYQRIKPELRNSVRDLSEADAPVIFMLPDDSLADKGEPRNEDFILEDARREVTNMIPDKAGDRLIKLFFRFVYPYFPVCSRTHMLSAEDTSSMLRSLPLSLLAALYATALPFFLYDDVLATTIIHSPPSESRLYRISWLAITQEIHTPRLATLQACLLLLQRAPTNRYVMDTPIQWSLTAWTVSVANVLGLCKSCSGWSGLPKWERRLRGRLWWAMYVMDKWAFLGAGMPSHIKDEDFDVPLPTPSTENEPNTLLAVPPHFYHLVHLTTIIDDIVKAYYTIRAASRTANNFAMSLELAKPLRARLREWKESFANAMPQPTTSPNLDYLESPQSDNTANNEGLDGNPALNLAYIVTAMTLYRALLRAVENERPSTDGVDSAMYAAGRSAVLAGAKECGKEAVEFVEDLSRGDVGVWDAFWHSWSRANFALASSFLMRVLVNINDHSSAPDDEEVSEVKALIFRWRRVLRLGSGNAGNGMMSLALLRIEGSLLQEEMVLRPTS